MAYPAFPVPDHAPLNSCSLLRPHKLGRGAPGWPARSDSSCEKNRVSPTKVMRLTLAVRQTQLAPHTPV